MEANSVPTDVKEMLERNQEVLLIVANPDHTIEGESNVAVFSKLLNDGSIVTPILTDILINLLNHNDTANSDPSTTAIGA